MQDEILDEYEEQQLQQSNHQLPSVVLTLEHPRSSPRSRFLQALHLRKAHLRESPAEVPADEKLPMQTRSVIRVESPESQDQLSATKPPTEQTGNGGTSSLQKSKHEVRARRLRLFHQYV